MFLSMATWCCQGITNWFLCLSNWYSWSHVSDIIILTISVTLLFYKLQQRVSLLSHTGIKNRNIMLTVISSKWKYFVQKDNYWILTFDMFALCCAPGLDDSIFFLFIFNLRQLFTVQLTSCFQDDEAAHPERWGKTVWYSWRHYWASFLELPYVISWCLCFFLTQ